MMKESSEKFPTGIPSSPRDSVLYFQPEAIPIRFTLQSFPQSATVKNNSGLPWSVCITPFMSSDLIYCNTDCIPVKLIARCINCFAYINPFCELRGRYWKCAMCFEVNPIKKDQKRYRRIDADERLPELTEQVVEYEIPLETKGGVSRTPSGFQWTGNSSGDNADSPITTVAASMCPPIVIALIDETGSEAYKLAVVKSLKAAIAEMPDEVCLGIFMFSSRLGFFDLSSEKPNIQFMQLGDAEDSASMLVDMVCFEETVFPLSKFRANANIALENLMHSYFWVAEVTEAEEPERRLGAAVSALFGLASYDDLYEGPKFTPAGVRLGIYLSGRPNFGPGTISLTTEEQAPENPLYVDKTAEAFYSKLGSEAAQQATCFHIFAVTTAETEQFIGLQTLLPLAHLSGGQVTLHHIGQSSIDPGEKLDSTVTAALGHNVAHNCLLRVRTSPEFSPSRTNQFGHWSANPELSDLWHAGAVGEDSSLCLDLEFASPAGFTMDDQNGPMVQVAFAYTTVRYVNARSGQVEARGFDRHRHKTSDEGKTEENQEEGEALLVPVTVRRLRVLTVQGDYSSDLRDIYNQCDVPTIIGVILYKVLEECQSSSISEARILLSDWLVNFYTCLYKYQRKLNNEDIRISDKMLLHDRHFGNLLRSVYGMLHMELLKLTGVSLDQRASHISSFMGIEPSCVKYAVYPGLQAFDSPDRRIAKNLPLSRKAMISSGGKIFILDAFWTIIIYFSEPQVIPNSKVNEGQEPDQASKEDNIILQSTGLVKSFLKKRMKIRTVLPEVIKCSMGSKEAYFFDMYLLDDKELPDSKVSIDGFAVALVKQLQMNFNDMA